MIGVVTGGLGLIGDRGKQIVSFVGFALALALALIPATASAADPVNAQYNSSLEQIPVGGSGGSAGGGGGGEGGLGSLPFTGLDVLVLAAVAAVLLGAGLMLRRRRAPEVES